MKTRNERKTETPFTMGINDLAARYGLGLSKAREIGAVSGAKIKLGTRVVYRVDLCDAYVASQVAE